MEFCNRNQERNGFSIKYRSFLNPLKLGLPNTSLKWKICHWAGLEQS